MAQACAAAGRRLDLTAVNHWDRAIQTHSANHPQARHVCHGLDEVDPRALFDGQRLDVLIASPECTHHSTARGGKPMQDQSRSTAWHVVRWADALRPKWILVENVREWESWGPLGANNRPLKKRRGETFQAWLQAIRSLGYTVDRRLLNAADFGAATSRTRLFVLARRGKGPIPWPEPTHAREPGPDLFGARPRWRGAREVIDWGIPCPSIFTRKRPLSANTLRRIAEGLRRFGGPAAEPFLVLLRGTQAGQVAASARSADDPAPTLSAGGEHVGVVEPLILSQHSADGAKPCDRPVPAITTICRHGLIQPFVMGMSQTGSNGCRMRGDDAPLPTVTTADDLRLVRPFIVPPNYGEREGQAPRTHDIDDPTPTIVATASHGVCRPFLVPYNSTGEADSPDDPMRTLTSRDRLGLVTPSGVRLDIGFRMLQPAELAAAMGFPATYKFAGNRGEVVKQVGNAVSVEQSFALTRVILEAMPE